MYKEVSTKVTEIIFEDEKIQLVKTTDGAGKAILYLDFLQRVFVNDTITINITATALRLGTGGWDIVTNVEGQKNIEIQGEGHIMKARYMPSQHTVLSVEAQESPYHSLFEQSFQLKGDYILLAELHSMLPIIYSMVKILSQSVSMAIIISDEAAIPLRISEHIRILQQDSQVYTITCGQAFGGDYEAVNIQTALQFAKQQLQTDFVVISLGPGVVGTGTKYGFSGMALAEWANIIGALKGTPVWIPRISFADKRNRHKGISHHTLTPLFEFTYAKSIVPIPNFQNEWDTILDEQIQTNYADHVTFEKHPITKVESLLKQGVTSYPLELSTMGRTIETDFAFFLSVASAAYWLLEKKRIV